MIRHLTITAETDEHPVGDGLDTIAIVSTAVPGDDGLPLIFNNYRRVSPGTYVHLDDVRAMIDAHILTAHEEGRAVGCARLILASLDEVT